MSPVFLLLYFTTTFSAITLKLVEFLGHYVNGPLFMFEGNGLISLTQSLLDNFTPMLLLVFMRCVWALVHEAHLGSLMTQL